MDEIITSTINKYCGEGLIQIILSNSKAPEKIKKVLIRPVRMRGELYFQACEYRGKQVFHENYTREDLLLKLPDWFEDCFKQAQIWASEGQAVILVSKKGKVTVKEKKGGTEQEKNVGEKKGGAEQEKNVGEKRGGAEQEKNVRERKGKSNQETMSKEHNREKNYILAEGHPVPFLVDLGVMTPEGKVVHARYDKFRQINRFLEFIEDILPELPRDGEVKIIDFGCGKSYLTFAMYYYLHELKHYPLHVVGLDLKEDVIAHCAVLAERYGYEGLKFLQGDIASYTGANAVDMVVTLHACDTATDAALKKAVDWGARVILSVPCCQHELNQTLENEMLKPVLRYGLLKERIAALITDGLRADLLEQKGYKVQVLEFIDMEHTPKNILLRAVKREQILPRSLKEKRRAAYEHCIGELNVKPTLYRAFEDQQETE